jgi:hypothetical protein
MWLSSTFAAFLLCVTPGIQNEFCAIFSLLCATSALTFTSFNSSPFLSYQFPPNPDSKIVSLSCPSNNNPGCQKTPYILRMTFASSLYFLAMCVRCVCHLPMPLPTAL